MIALQLADAAGFHWAQRQVGEHHYLHAPVDPRCIGILMFGRPEAARCYSGALTYGSQADVAAGRAAFDRWSILNLARVWLSPHVQAGGIWCRSSLLPGYTDRCGTWRSTLASHIIGEALSRIGYDYLAAHPPVDCSFPYQIRAVLSYCDRHYHKGTVYRAAGFRLARTNGRGIETWYTTAVTSLTAEQDADIRHLAERSPRSRRIRAERAVIQIGMEL